MKYFTLFVCVFLGLSWSKLNAQSKPVEWNFFIEQIDDSTAYFVIKTDIADGWKVYGTFPFRDDNIPTIKVQKYEEAIFDDDIGPTPLEVVFEKETLLKGAIFSTQRNVVKIDKVFRAETVYYVDKVELKQKIKHIPNKILKGYIYYMTCNSEKCLPPTYVNFSITISE